MERILRIYLENWCLLRIAHFLLKSRKEFKAIVAELFGNKRLDYRHGSNPSTTKVEAKGTTLSQSYYFFLLSVKVTKGENTSKSKFPLFFFSNKDRAILVFCWMIHTQLIFLGFPGKKPWTMIEISSSHEKSSLWPMNVRERTSGQVGWTSDERWIVRCLKIAMRQQLNP